MARLALLLAVASAQTWRTITSARQLHGETALTIDVTYGVGRFRLSPADRGTMYRMEMRYDEERFLPVREYDEGAGTLRLGVRGRGTGAQPWSSDRRRNEPTPWLDLALAPGLPLVLNLELGAVMADLDLGGLSIAGLTYRTGASESSIRFGEPNPVPCDSMRLEAGAAAFRVTGIANAGCRRLRFAGGVGDVTLDFSGRWTRTMDADINVSLGALRLRLPHDVGVAMQVSRFLATFEPAGFTRRGDSYFSANYTSSRYQLNLKVSATLGGVDVEWID